MKWNVFLGTLVLGVGLSAQSFGFELLDRMLGVGGCGCEPRATKCGCDPKCGVDPKCGCEPKGRTQKGGDPKCGADPKGCTQKGGDPKCGADPKGGCDSKEAKCRTPLLRCRQPLLLWGAKDGCTQKGGDPKCGADPKACTQKGGDPKCGATQKGCCEGRPLPRLGSLLDRLFTCNRCGARATGCADKGCWDGCEDGKGKTTKADKADGKKDGPMPPAPVVDPSAYMSSYKVIPASRIVR